MVNTGLPPVHQRHWRRSPLREQKWSCMYPKADQHGRAISTLLVENRSKKWKLIWTEKLSCLNYCYYWPGFGSVFTSEGLGWFLATLLSTRQHLNYWQESKSPSIDSFSLSTRSGHSLSPTIPRDMCGWKGKQWYCISHWHTTPTSPCNNWTNRRCPAANLDCFQLQDPSIWTKNGTTPESRDHFNSQKRKRQTRTCCSPQLLKCYEKKLKSNCNNVFQLCPYKMAPFPTVPPFLGRGNGWLAGTYIFS